MSRGRSSQDETPAERAHGGDAAVGLYGRRLGAGALVASFVVESLESEGGFGAVYRARHAVTGRAAAVKLLHAHVAADAALVKRFRRECEIVAALRHPRVVELLEIGQLVDRRPFLVMEWIDGETLERAVRVRGAWPLGDVVAVVEQIAGALGAAHAAGVVHRDLKAANVMRLADSGAPRVKLLDFGIAKALDPGAPRLTATDARVGTPGYMAPEQILGEAVQPATDVYALGVLAWFLLAGRLPFVAATALELEALHLRQPPPRAGDAAAVPPAVDDVLARCLAKRAADRFAGAEDAARALRRAVDERGAPPVSGGRMDAVGVHVAGSGEALAAARVALDAAGFALAVDAERELLGVAAASHRRAALELALALAGREPSLAITVHAAPVSTLAVGGAPQFVGGALLALDAWTPGHPGGGVVAATDAALAGVVVDGAILRKQSSL